MTPTARWIGIVLFVLVGVGAPVRLGVSAGLIAPDPNDLKVVARGKVVYDEQCVRCHGAKLEGQPDWRHRLPNGRMPAPPHDPTGHTWHHSDKQLFDITKLGLGAARLRERHVGVQGKLGDSDIWAVLSYIESTWPADIRAKQQRMNQDQ